MRRLVGRGASPSRFLQWIICLIFGHSYDILVVNNEPTEAMVCRWCGREDID